ncbi:prepilin-type N-terminal cleavage/methylation domain-containing protein [Anatilimnocola floriformis]|uniref:prepilin-type N-terminal cleavage/methylation domain-containing protein n=1 Tax=Anatilimnocola floriformis TaxID=2948575 RepID=UPI0020C1FA0F|nr:prepilin-type N-terminal cleavage/methylation domain-containing protein [Anatilimnocola floriformis]
MRIRRGFVFLELLIALAILALIVGAIFCTFWHFVVSPLSLWIWLGGLFGPFGVLFVLFFALNLLADIASRRGK